VGGIHGSAEIDAAVEELLKQAEAAKSGK